MISKQTKTFALRPINQLSNTAFRLVSNHNKPWGSDYRAILIMEELSFISRNLRSSRRRRRRRHYYSSSLMYDLECE